MQGNRLPRGGGSFGIGGDPFAGFGDFGSFGGPGTLIPRFFGGRGPFDDPFFTQPFDMFESNFFGPSPFTRMPPMGFIEYEPRQTQQRQSRGPIIEELNSDDEKGEGGNNGQGKEKNDNPRKHGRLRSDPYVVAGPDDEAQETSDVAEPRRNYIQYTSNYGRASYVQQQPQFQSFTYQSSVTHGGPNGAYYTCSNTRRTGSDGVTFEENKEADSSTGRATHRISRGIHDKGHTMTRKLNSDGMVDAMQTLHNLNQGSSSYARIGQTRGGWALPSTGHAAGANVGVGDRAIPRVQHSSKAERQKGRQ
ncbi:Myeloid leukemia factor [Dillenia turbinata]|uniref:Myeloid leukemia factor n=1 Tax=Dillenia turbinata TaxID=194707 RepID=A0AAN8VP04_9MAGN